MLTVQQGWQISQSTSSWSYQAEGHMNEIVIGRDYRAIM
jgi:hypothetical protein